jgi:hypothetical protein
VRGDAGPAGVTDALSITLGTGQGVNRCIEQKLDPYAGLGPDVRTLGLPIEKFIRCLSTFAFPTFFRIIKTLIYACILIPFKRAYILPI